MATTSPLPESSVSESVRKSRWSEPFGEMTDESIAEVLRTDLFSRICKDEASAREELFKSFGTSVSIYGILKNDTRIHSYEKGEIVVRKGDYGNSAYFLIDGEWACILSPDLSPDVLGQPAVRTLGLFASLAKDLKGVFSSTVPEYRSVASDQTVTGLGTGMLPASAVDEVLDTDKYETLTIKPNMIVGEMGAIFRTPRSATIVASRQSRALEIRWQGLRDLMAADDEIAGHIDGIYRARSLDATLNRDPLFRAIPSEFNHLVSFQTYGKYDEWSSDYISHAGDDFYVAHEQEEVIAKQGDYCDGIYVVQNGFARICSKYGSGYKTHAYIGEGRIFGLSEALHNWQNPEESIPLQTGFYAIGYANVIFIPTRLVEEYVLPGLADHEQRVKQDLRQIDFDPRDGVETAVERSADGSDIFEFLAQNRFMIGTETMVIDTNKCTRCDDCVRACSIAHDGNPRFQRHGLVSQHYMIVNACMHCADPVCMIGCPTGAIHRETLGGQVVVNNDTCIGCSTCYNNCPYDAIRMVTIRDKQGTFRISASGESQGTPIYKATKCDLCVEHRAGPACVRACPHDALARVDMRNSDTIDKFLS